MPDNAMQNEQGQPTRLPIPDPTILTTEALRRDIGALRELLESKIATGDQLTQQRFDSLRELLETRIVGSDRLTQQQFEAAATAIAKAETTTSKQIDQLGELFSTGIAGLNTRFEELKERVGTIEGLKRGGQQAFSGVQAAVGLAGGIIVLIVAFMAFRGGP